MMLPSSVHMDNREKLAVGKAKFIVYLTFKNMQGKDLYAFYAINGKDVDNINALIYSGTPFDPAELNSYGTHIYSDYGTPNEDIIAWMEKDYCFNREAISNPLAAANIAIVNG